ncbi:MAG TPA: amino acid permease [Steroidobacteraceae bacterium]|nr:amino acid permease [Steroidobacteraceae bacterium]
MNEPASSGGVSYQQVGADYFEKRGLRRYAKVWSLWALGVGAVISGHYSGWNFGLANGFGSMLVAGLIIAAMYWGLIFSLAEMSPALPHTGAAYSFARSAMGPWGGMFTGLAESIEYIITPAVIVFFIGSYLQPIFGTAEQYQPLYWIGAYAVFLFLNLYGVELSFRVSVFVTVGALAVLAVYWISAIPHFDLHRWALNIAVDPASGAAVELPDGNGAWFPFGWKGVLATLPFAVWLFLAIEQLPLAAEESADPKKDMPKGLIAGMSTLMLSATLISFLNAGIGSVDGMHGAFSLSSSNWPLLDGFNVTFGAGAIAKVLALLATIGLIASFHTIIYAYGRQIYSLARAGYYLPFMSLTNARKVPHMALFAGTALGLVTMMILWFTTGAKRGDVIGAILLNMAVFGAMISYAMQGLSFIVLRTRMPNIARPYRSPLGVFGATMTIVIALVTLWYQLQDPKYQKAVYAVAIFYALGILYFAFYGRSRLILSPEEEFATSKGAKGHA